MALYLLQMSAPGNPSNESLASFEMKLKQKRKPSLLYSVKFEYTYFTDKVYRVVDKLEITFLHY